MNEQNGESKEEEVTDEKEIKAVDSIYKLKLNEKTISYFQRGWCSWQSKSQLIQY